MDKERKYTVKFENLSGLELDVLMESLIRFLAIHYSNERFLISDEKLESLNKLLKIVQPVWDEYETYQKGRNDEYELYLKLKAKFEDREKSANDEPPKELRGHNWRDSFVFK